MMTERKPRVAQVRCDDCLALVPRPQLGVWKDELICMACRVKRTKAPRLTRPKLAWYVIAVLSGQERKARSSLKRRARIQDREYLVGKVILARQQCVEMLYSGERVLRKRKKFPGYLIAQVGYCPDADQLVRGTPGVMGFMPYYDLELLRYDEWGHRVDKHQVVLPPPTPLAEDEVQFLLMQEASARVKSAPKVATGLAPGDIVEIRDGAWKGQEAVVKSVSGEGGTKPLVKCEVQMWGIPTSLELEHWQIKAR